MKNRSFKKVVLPLCLVLLTVAALLLVPTLLRRRAAKPYEHLISLTYYRSDGYGIREEMISDRYTFDFVGGTVEVEINRNFDHTILQSDRYPLSESQLARLKTVLIDNRFFSLPETYDNTALDADYTSFSIETSQQAHTTGGFMPNNKNFAEIERTVRTLLKELGV